MPQDNTAKPVSEGKKVQETPTLSKEFEDFIYLISHDVRSSVRALIELPQWIVEDLEKAGVRIEGSVGESIAMMNVHTGRLDRMLVDLLTFSRVGRMQTVREVDLADALEEVLEEVAIPAGFRVVKALDCDRLTIGDRDILTLLTALISNAVKHHDRKVGTISVTSHQEKGDIVIAVRDDGPGIPERFRERVFGAMTTLKPRDEVEGSGMGLAICQKIASVYHGTASIRDTADQRGATIEVRLPLAPVI